VILPEQTQRRTSRSERGETGANATREQSSHETSHRSGELVHQPAGGERCGNRTFPKRVGPEL
jgi:hypothetical protein